MNGRTLVRAYAVLMVITIVSVVVIPAEYHPLVPDPVITVYNETGDEVFVIDDPEAHVTTTSDGVPVIHHDGVTLRLEAPARIVKHETGVVTTTDTFGKED